MSPRAGLCSRAGVGFTAELARVVIEMPKAGKKNHILKDFFFPVGRKNNAKTGKEFGIVGKKVTIFNAKISPENLICFSFCSARNNSRLRRGGDHVQFQRSIPAVVR